MSRQESAGSLPGKSALLQRFDWHFLLPRPETGAFELMVVPDAPDDLIELLREVGIARHV